MAGKVVLAALFVVAGIMHFLTPAPFLRIVPPTLPWPAALVALSGAGEIAGGVGILLSRTRRSAAFGLILLLIVVFPANIYMVVAHTSFPGIAVWLLWLRLPTQFLLIAWVWRYTK